METNLLDAEKTYLEGEMANIQANVTMSSETFQMCSDNVTIIFNENFLKFQDIVNACTAVWSWARLLNRRFM